MSEPSYRILMVCTGNICRSPLMERLFLARLRERLSPDQVDRFQVSSAGTWGLDDWEMEPSALETLVELGGDATGFRSRPVTPDLLDVDLVLVATREHRRLVVTDAPHLVSRVLTARELARLLEPVSVDDIDAKVPAGGDPVERMRVIVDAALANRGLVPLPTDGEDDIADPYGRDRAAYARAAAEIDAALAVPLNLLFPPQHD